MNQSIVLGFSVLAEIRALKTNKETHSVLRLILQDRKQKSLWLFLNTGVSVFSEHKRGGVRKDIIQAFSAWKSNLRLCPSLNDQRLFNNSFYPSSTQRLPRSPNSPKEFTVFVAQSTMH